MKARQEPTSSAAVMPIRRDPRREAVAELVEAGKGKDGADDQSAEDADFEQPPA